MTGIQETTSRFDDEKYNCNRIFRLLDECDSCDIYKGYEIAYMRLKKGFPSFDLKHYLMGLGCEFTFTSRSGCAKLTVISRFNGIEMNYPPYFRKTFTRIEMFAICPTKSLDLLHKIDKFLKDNRLGKVNDLDYRPRKILFDKTTCFDCFMVSRCWSDWDGKKHLL